MFGKRMTFQRAGKPIQARTINQLSRGASWLSKLMAGGGLNVHVLPHGTSIRLGRTPVIFAKLSGSSSPYSWQQAYVDKSSGTPTPMVLPGGASGTGNAYEDGNRSGLAGWFVWLQPQGRNEFTFQAIRLGGTPCTTGNVCGIVTSDGCSGGGPVIGAAITVKDRATPPNTIGTCATTGQVTFLFLFSGGSGWRGAKLMLTTEIAYPRFVARLRNDPRKPFFAIRLENSRRNHGATVLAVKEAVNPNFSPRQAQATRTAPGIRWGSQAGEAAARRARSMWSAGM
jgi:hypothetical protein